MISGFSSTSSTDEEWNNLYYQNLDLGDPKAVQSRVVQRLRDFRFYLENAERKLSRKKYTFTFNVYSIRGSLLPKSGGEIHDPFKADFFSFDPEGEERLPEGAIKWDRKEVTLDGGKRPETVFAHFAGCAIPFAFKMKSAVLSNIEPHNINEDEEDAALDFLSESDSLRSGKDRIKIIKNLIRRESKLIVTNVPASGSFIVEYNTYILKRQRNAVEDLAISPLKHHLPLINLMRQERDFTWEVVQSIANPERWFVLTNEELDGTAEQREFVQKALGTPDFAILEGPPGSGKTTALLELIAQVAGKGGRVLMVASTHVAVDNVLERLVATQIETSEGRKSLKEACGIIPLRIGDEGNVSDMVRPFCLGSFPETERKRIIKSLSVVIHRKEQKPSQEKLYHTLNDDPEEGKRQIETLLLSTANLICGTTIGILKAPNIMGASHTLEALFDYVILDEASKTTFQEFLVPALYGRRWILSGDVRQLSPYVDQAPIEENLRAARTFTPAHGETDRELCCATYQASRYSRAKGSALLLRDTDEEVEECARLAHLQVEGLVRACQGEKIDLPSIVVTAVTSPPQTDLERCNILSSNLIITKKSLLGEIEPYLPPDIQRDERALRDVFSPEFIRRMGGFGARPGETLIWEREISWRIGRMHELKNNPEKYQRLYKDILLLVPYFERTDDPKRPRNQLVLDDIEATRRIALPSVLELLQEGFETRREVKGAEQIALYSGLPANVLASRHTRLSYQHRMDPEISLLPREYVYGGQALSDAGGRNGMKEKRAWEYARYSSRCVWMDIRPLRREVSSERTWFNRAEVKAMKDEFVKFIEWARDHPNPGDDNGSWSVAFLSFYTGQTREIMKELEAFSHRKGIYSGFELPGSHVKVEICTVDRFQGHEADVVFLSFVRPRGRGVGFLDNQNRLNVAVTRARYQLVMFGDRKNFEGRGDSFLKALATESAKGPIVYRGRDA